MEQKFAKMSMKDASTETTSTPKPVYGTQPLLEKKPRNTEGAAVTVGTNIRKITLAPNTPIYKYAVTVNYVYVKANGQEVFQEMSKSTHSGTEHDNDKSRCQKIYMLAVKKYPELRKSGPFFYDRQASLYSLSMLKDVTNMNFTVTDVSIRPNFKRAEFQLAEVAQSFQTSSNDIGRSFNACPKMVDKTLFEVLNIIVSGPAFERANVVTMGNCVHYLYDHSQTSLPQLTFKQGGRYAAVGTSKSVKTLQGAPSGDKSASLYITTELKTTLFHPDNEKLTDIFQTFPGFNANLRANSHVALNILKAMNRLEVWLAYGETESVAEESRIVRISGFGNSANEQTFDQDGVETNVTKYYRKRYGITLAFPNLFTVVARGRDGRNQHLPAECLRICSNQPVRTEQMIGTEQADMIKMSAAKPDVRKRTTDTVVREVGIASNSINGFIKVGEPEQVTGIILAKPEIVFGGNKKVVWNDPNKRGAATDFSAAGTFARPAQLTNWEIVFVQNETLNDTAQLLVREMQQSGMTVNNPITTFIQGGRLPGIFADAKRANRQLLLFVTKTRYNFHQEIKALEQEYDVLTQEVRFETAQKLAQQPQTRKNIVNKINMKLDGLNFLVNTKSFSDRRLIVGFETSSKGGAGPDAPICVGYAANMMANPHQFAGDYVFVKKQADVYGPMIKKTIIKIIQTVTVKRCKPAEVFVYFSGVTEGQFGLINEAYVGAIKSACDAFSTGEGKDRVNYRPHITIIAASKTHMERLYKTGPREAYNLEPGTVVDHTIVSPVWNEFYLASSVARQGTTKAAKYTIVFSTNKALSMKAYEELTNELCYEHQIVFHPTSLPIPLYLAGGYSSRGSANLAFRGPVFTDGAIDLAATNAKLTYENKKLFGTRYNA